MAIKGLSIPVCGEYSYTSSTGAVAYTNGFIADKAVEYSAEFTTAENNPLYGDNGIAENDKGTFQSGSLSLTTTDLPQELSKKLLGLTQRTETWGEGSAQKTATVNVYDDNAKAPYLGFGIIEMHQINDVDKFRAIFFNKVFFAIPSEAATTKGESIEWQTKEITGEIMRSDEVITATSSDDGVMHPYMEDSWFDTEALALEWLAHKCGYAPTA